MRGRPALVVALSIACSCVSASDWSECVDIPDDAARLSCYDRVARSAVAAPAASAQPSTSPAATPAAAASEPAEPKRIESRIVGTFEGWRQGTRFKLENGQTWESIGTGTFNVRKIESPPVVLERDFLGQLKMKIEGVGTRVSVRRVDD